MVDFQIKERYNVQDLVQVMELLRAPGGCPWDREQTHQSIRRNMLEEAFEVVEAIDEDDPVHLQENWAMCCCRWSSMPAWRRKRAGSTWKM